MIGPLPPAGPRGSSPCGFRFVSSRCIPERRGGYWIRYQCIGWFRWIGWTRFVPMRSGCQLLGFDSRSVPNASYFKSGPRLVRRLVYQRARTCCHLVSSAAATMCYPNIVSIQYQPVLAFTPISFSRDSISRMPGRDGILLQPRWDGVGICVDRPPDLPTLGFGDRFEDQVKIILD